MLTRLCIASIALLGLSAAPQALGQGHSGNQNQNQAAPTLSLDARPAPVVFSRPSTLSGRLSGAHHGGVPIRLEQDATRPYGDAYRSTPSITRTAANGGYSFTVKPLVNTQYRVVALIAPPVLSPPRLVLVRTLVGLRLSATTVHRGARVRFSGSVFPAHDGRTALIQKRSASGRFVTVARTLLRDAGADHSRYSRRVRILRDGVYRVKVPGHDDHINGFSRLRTILVR